VWSCCTEGGLISRFKIIIFRQIHTHSRPIPSRPPPEDRPPARRPTARRSSTTSSSPATGRPSAARSTPAIREIVRHPNTARHPGIVPTRIPPIVGRPSATGRLSAIRIPSARRSSAIRIPPTKRSSTVERSSAAVGNKDMVLTASAAAACFPRAEIGPMGNNDARQGSSAGFHRFPPQPHAPGKKEKPPPGAKKALSAPGRRKSSCQGRRKASAPLAAGKSS